MLILFYFNNITGLGPNQELNFFLNTVVLTLYNRIIIDKNIKFLVPLFLK